MSQRFHRTANYQNHKSTLCIVVVIVHLWFEHRAVIKQRQCIYSRHAAEGAVGSCC